MAAAALLAASVVYAAYHPSDSVLVERGDALAFSSLALATAGLASLGSNKLAHPRRMWVKSSALDLVTGALACWIMLSAIASAPPGNLRVATNEAWLWIGGVALFCAARRIGTDVTVRKALVALILGTASGLAVHGLHQQWVTLPENRAAFEADPDSVLAAAGLDAPHGSAERAIFAGRLYDGGPSATFALANSLAGVLLVGVLLASGMIALAYRQQSQKSLIGVLSGLAICGICLVLTHSRTALVAVVFGWLLLWIGPRSLALINSRKRLLAVLMATLVLAASAIGLLWSSSRLLSIAPSSLEFRFQYWRATLAMVAEHPVFGVGPGNFQALYEQYRDVTTSEQIAEPHNFVFETLASGGIPAGVLLLATLGLGLSVGLVRDRELRADVMSGQHSVMLPGHGSRWVYAGAAIALFLVWGFGAATFQLPDVGANLFALPVAVAVAWLAGQAVKSISEEEINRLFAAVLGALLLHLSTSGGWTVPGLAVLVWISAGMLTTLVPATERATRSSTGKRLAAVGCLAAMLLLYVMSLLPTMSARQQITIARAAMRDGLYTKAERSLQAAIEADRWSPDPRLALADLRHWQLIASDQRSLRSSWESLLREVQDLGGQNPGLYRAIGIQQLHLYQRHGNRRDLLAAEATFSAAARMSPADQWIVAQLAAISAALDQARRAAELASRAQELSRLGINVEREFEFQMIYPARRLGSSVIDGPSRRTAPAVLAEAGILSEPRP